MTTTESPPSFALAVDPQSLKPFVEAVVAATLRAVDWPVGRLCLTEAEAAACVGVRTHTLRDLRLLGQLPTRKMGRKVVYLREDLLAYLESKGQDHV
jgi:hypothetical protein